MRPEAAYLYDAVRLYASAARQVLLAGQNPSNGRLIMDHIKGTSYHSTYRAYVFFIIVESIEAIIIALVVN